MGMVIAYRGEFINFWRDWGGACMRFRIVYHGKSTASWHRSTSKSA